MKPTFKGLFWRLILLAALFAFLVGTATAQTPPPEKRTLFVIGDLDSGLNFPVLAYIIVQNSIYLAETWRATTHDLGPVGLAVDENNENLFVSYESFDGIEIFDARDATPLGTITLWGTDDLAGMVVHQSRGHLYVVDRRERNIFVFDTTTFASVETWLLPTGNGAWGIDLMNDWLFVTDQSETVRWYDIDTHGEIGNVTLTYRNAGIAVTDYPEPLIFTQGHDGGSGMSPFMTKYAMNTGVQQWVAVGNDPKGITVNPALQLAYGVSDYWIQIVDTTSMSIISTENVNHTWNPTDCTATFIPFGGTVQKTCVSHPNGKFYKGDAVEFEISIQNRHALPIHVLPLQDQYDTTQLTYVDALPASDDNNDDGQIDWTDLIISNGGIDLATGDFLNVTANFMATDDCGGEMLLEGVNTAMIHNVEDTQGTMLPDASGQFDYEINCKCRTNLDCDDGVFCNGAEICEQTGECTSPGNPCPIDDGLYCNGEEGPNCDEELDECEHLNIPCEDDGEWCNGSEVCNEDTDSCENSGPPCTDDGQFCNGTESCDDNDDECVSSGDPCQLNEECNEATDTCEVVAPGDDDDDTTDEDPDPLWPEGKVTGGCCGCDE